MFETPQHSAPIRRPAGAARGALSGTAPQDTTAALHRSRLEARSRSHHPTARSSRMVSVPHDEPIEVPSFVLPRHQRPSSGQRPAAAVAGPTRPVRDRSGSARPQAAGRTQISGSGSLADRSAPRLGSSSFARPHVLLRWIVALGLCVAAVIGVAATGAAASSEPEAGVEHVVRPGESLWSIASGLGLDVDTRDLVDQLMAVNGSDVLRTGEVVTIPAELASLAAAERE